MDRLRFEDLWILMDFSPWSMVMVGTSPKDQVAGTPSDAWPFTSFYMAYI